MSATLEGKNIEAVVKAAPKGKLMIELPKELVRFFGLEDGSKLKFWQHPLNDFICVRDAEDE